MSRGTHPNKPGHRAGGTPVARRKIDLQDVASDAKLAAYEGTAPAWLRWLDDKSVAAVPAEGGAIVGMEWADLCAAVAPHLGGTDAAFASEVEGAIPGTLASLDASFARALEDVRHGRTHSAEDDLAPPLVCSVAAAAAECALRVLVARATERVPTELVPVTKVLDALPRAYAEGPAHWLVAERNAERLAPRATAGAAIVAYLVSAPFGPSVKQGGWIGGQIERARWGWFEAAVVPFTYTASVARLVAAGCTWSGRFSVALSATRGRVATPAT